MLAAFFSLGMKEFAAACWTMKAAGGVHDEGVGVQVLDSGQSGRHSVDRTHFDPSIPDDAPFAVVKEKAFSLLKLERFPPVSDYMGNV